MDSFWACCIPKQRTYSPVVVKLAQRKMQDNGDVCVTRLTVTLSRLLQCHVQIAGIGSSSSHSNAQYFPTGNVLEMQPMQEVLSVRADEARFPKPANQGCKTSIFTNNTKLTNTWHIMYGHAECCRLVVRGGLCKVLHLYVKASYHWVVGRWDLLSKATSSSFSINNISQGKSRLALCIP